MSKTNSPVYRKCKYCNNRARVGREVCGHCSDKIVLVRRLVAAGDEIKQILREKAEREEEQK